MRDARMHGRPSKHRDDSVEDNLKRFAEMKTGSDEGRRWCLRAKISVDDPNKAMRDPVIYRCNPTPHHRIGYVFRMICTTPRKLTWVTETNGRSILHTTSLAPLLIRSKALHMHFEQTSIATAIPNIGG
jgi:hypothetical protein